MTTNSASFDVPRALNTIKARLRIGTEDLANRLGVSVASISGWRAGRTAPQPARIPAIKKLLAEATNDAAPPEDIGADLVARARAMRGTQATTALAVLHYCPCCAKDLLAIFKQPAVYRFCPGCGVDIPATLKSICG